MIEASSPAILLEAVFQAAKREAVDLRRAEKEIERLRSDADGESDPFELWAAIDNLVGGAESQEARRTLLRVRELFEDQWTAAAIDHVETALRQSSDDGWREWISVIAKAVASFRLRQAVRVANHPFSFPAERDAEGIKTALSRMSDARWVEAYDEIGRFSAAESVPTLTRARLMVMLAEIDRFHLGNVSQAKEKLDLAQKMAPDDARVLAGIGDYWLAQNRTGEAKSFFERAMAAAPGRSYGYVGLGELSENLDDLEAAERWYKRAIAAAPGDTQGYRKLIQLFGRPELFSERREALSALVQQVIAVDSEEAYWIRTVVGDVYKENRLYDEAHQQYRLAIQLHPGRPLAYLSEGYCFLDEDRPDEAANVFEKAIEAAPEAYDGYWALTWFYEGRREWERALEWYRKAPRHRREWVGVVQAKIGEMHTLLDQPQEAEKVLWSALGADRDNAMAKDALQGLADRLYKEKGDAEGALRIYNRLRDMLGQAYTGDYHNRVGNLRYYQGDYAGAVSEYRKAIEAIPDDDVIYANLARAWQEEIQKPGRGGEAVQGALEAFKEAQRLKPNEEYRAAIARLTWKKEAIASYGEEALLWRRSVTPIVVEAARDLIPFTEGGVADAVPEALSESLNRMRERVHADLGVSLPGVLFRGNDRFYAGYYTILIMEVPAASGSIAAVEEAGLEPWDAAEFLVRRLEAAIRQNLGEFLGHQEVAHALRREPALGFDSRNLTAMTSVLRGLIAEGVTIRPLKEIHTLFVRLHADGHDAQTIVEKIRSTPALRPRLPGNDGNHELLTLGPGFQRTIRDSIVRTDSGAVLALENRRCRIALSTVGKAVGEGSGVAVVVDDATLRPFVRALTGIEHPGVPVLARPELRSGSVVAGGIIELENEPEAGPVDFKSPWPAPTATGPDTASTSKLGVTVHLAESEDPSFRKAFSAMRERLFYDLGLIFPEVRVETDPSLKPNQARFEINGREHPPMASHASGLAETLKVALDHEIRGVAASFQTVDATEFLLRSMEGSFPDLVAAARKKFSTEEITLVLRGLLEEEISIRDLRTILEGMLAVHGTYNVDLGRFIPLTPATQNLCPAGDGRDIDDLGAYDYCDFVREWLKRYISQKYTGGRGTLIAYPVGPDIEQRLRKGWSEPLSDEEAARLNAAVGKRVGGGPRATQNPVLLAAPDVRRDLRKLIERDFPALAVLSYQELSPETTVQPIGVISWDETPSR